MPVRILHVVPSYIPAWRYGGPIHSVHGLCRALAAGGHAVDVATTNVDGDEDSDVPLGSPVDLDGVKVHYFPATRLRRLFHSPPLRRFIANGLRSWDLLHTHSVFLWPTAAAAQLARRSATPYVLSPRGMLVRELIERRSSWVKRAWIAAFERRNVEEASAVHVTSGGEAADLLEAGFRPRRIIEVPNGLDLPAPGEGAPAPFPGVPERYALFLGRITWKKGLDRLVTALAQAPGLELVVAGNDDEGHWPEIARLATRLGVIERVHYVGFVHGAAKGSLLARALMLVLASRSENFGNVVVEAMALGTPVVVTPEVGASSLVARTQGGIVTSAEPASLGGALRALASDAALRAQMGERARAAARGYEWSAIARRFESEYAQLLAAPGARARAP